MMTFVFMCQLGTVSMVIGKVTIDVVRLSGNQDWNRGITQCLWATGLSLVVVCLQIINLKVS